MNTRTETIRIEGMSCDHCVAAVRRALGEVDGVEVHDVRIGAADVAYDPDRVGRAEIDRVIDDAGFIVPAGSAS